MLQNQKVSEIAEPGGSLDAGERGGADAASSLAAQVTFILDINLKEETMEMNEYEYAIFQELLPECLQLSKENNVSLTDILLLRQLIVLQGLFDFLTKSKCDG